MLRQTWLILGVNNAHKSNHVLVTIARCSRTPPCRRCCPGFGAFLEKISARAAEYGVPASSGGYYMDPPVAESTELTDEAAKRRGADCATLALAFALA